MLVAVMSSSAMKSQLVRSSLKFTIIITKNMIK